MSESLNTLFTASLLVSLAGGVKKKRFASFDGAYPTPSSKAYALIQLGAAKVGGDSTGFANNTTTYNFSISRNGTPVAVSVVGSAAQTVTQLLAEIAVDLPGYTVTLESTRIKIEYNTPGANALVITDGTLQALIASLFGGGASIGTPVNGVAGGKAVGVYSADTDKDEMAPVDPQGILLVESGGSISALAEVEAGADGMAITKVGGVSNGIAMDAATGTGQIIRVIRGI